MSAISVDGKHATQFGGWIWLELLKSFYLCIDHGFWNGVYLRQDDDTGEGNLLWSDRGLKILKLSSMVTPLIPRPVSSMLPAKLAEDVSITGPGMIASLSPERMGPGWKSRETL